MRKVISTLLFLFVLSCATIKAQENITSITLPAEAPGTHRVYAELLGYGTSFFDFNKNVKVTIDLGQFQSKFKDYYILDENGKAMKFNSMVAAMNYMGERGWKFVQIYIVKERDLNVYHWLMYKDITDPEQIYDGLSVKNTETDPKKKKKKEHTPDE